MRRGRRVPGLEGLLRAREDRVALREDLFLRGDLVLQCGINLPGLPKRLPGDEARLEEAGRGILEALGWAVREVRSGVDEAGAYRTLLLRGDPRALKRAAVAWEERTPWGRLLDLDVVTPGGALSRSDLGLPPRRCLACLREAKACARLRGHRPEALRRRALLLWRGLLQG